MGLHCQRGQIEASVREHAMAHSLEVLIYLGVGMVVALVLLTGIGFGYSFVLAKGCVNQATRQGAILLQRIDQRNARVNIGTAQQAIVDYLSRVRKGESSSMKPVSEFDNVNCRIDALDAGHGRLLTCSADVTLKPPIDTIFGSLIELDPVTITSASVVES